MTAPDILSPEFARDPYPLYRVMRDDFPLFFHEATKSYVLSRYEDVERAFKDAAFSSKNYEWQLEPVHGRTILQMEGREHATHRNLLTPAFRGRDLQERFVPVIEKNARVLIEAFRARGEVDLVAEFATRFPINVIVEMLGLPMSDHHRFHAWYTSIMAFLSNLTGDPGVVEEGLKTRRELAEYMLPIIAERRRSPGGDLLSTLCSAEIDGVRMTDDEIRGFVSLLLTAGGETTDKAVASLFKNLVEHPEQLEAVRRDRALVDAAFAETLRYSPPVHMIMRTPLEDVTMSGGVIPAGSTVTCLIGAANRDERRYQDPDRFDVFRRDLDVERAFTGAANHTAFALGRHFCVGAILAKTEIQIATGLLLDAMTDIRFADGSPAEAGIFTRAPKSLGLRFSPAAS
jgi:pulcherriminic acid synthase